MRKINLNLRLNQESQESHIKLCIKPIINLLNNALLLAITILIFTCNNKELASTGAVQIKLTAKVAQSDFTIVVLPDEQKYSAGSKN